MNVRKLDDAHRYQLELILIGMLLAKEGDRQRILEAVQPEDLGRERLKTILKGVSDSDAAAVWSGFAMWDVAPGKSVLDSLLERLFEIRSEEKLRDAVAFVATSNALEDTDSLLAQLESATEMVRKHKQARNK